MITLVLINNKEISIGVDKFCFPIEDGKVQHETSQRIGSEVNNKIEEYNCAYEIAVEAYSKREFFFIQRDGKVTPQ